MDMHTKDLPSPPTRPNPTQRALTCRSLKTQACQGQAGALPLMQPYTTSSPPCGTPAMQRL